MKIKHNKVPTKQDIKDDLIKIVSHKQHLDSCFKSFDQLFDYTDGKLFESCYMTFDTACDFFCDKYALDSDEISWFIYDNDCGNGCHSVDIDENGKTVSVIVSDVDSFIRVLKSI